VIRCMWDINVGGQVTSMLGSPPRLRHELYPQQYRAMFVMNCKILKGEVLKFAPKQDKRASKRKRGKEVETESSAHNLETFHPVHCSICDTEVAVYDQDEVYHFFSVLASVP
jgi:hypothetical protein